MFCWGCRIEIPDQGWRVYPAGTPDSVVAAQSEVARYCRDCLKDNQRRKFICVDRKPFKQPRERWVLNG
jgi:hypothetical protein